MSACRWPMNAERPARHRAESLPSFRQRLKTYRSVLFLTFPWTDSVGILYL